MTEPYEFRNAKYINANQTIIDMEINHPTYGWIPFTAHPDDIEPIGKIMIDAATSAGNIAPYTAPAITSNQVDAERVKRTENGFIYNNVAYQCDLTSQDRITSSGADAANAITNGAQANDLRWFDPDHDFGWIATDNSVTPMDAQTMLAFAQAAKLWVSRHIFAAHNLKQMSPIPQDYTDDKYWP